MIKTIKLKDFQIHKETTLEFVPGVNVLVGESDAGKSSCFRGIIKTLFNKPASTGLIRFGKKTAVLQLDMVEGRIERSIGKENKILINNEELSAFGQDIPEEVLKFHNMDRDLNIQTQGDPFFLLQNTPGQVASYFSSIAGLGDIDIAISSIKQYEKRKKAEQRAVVSIIEETTEQLEEYQNLELIGVQLQTIEKTQEQIVETQEELDELEGLIRLISEKEDTVEQNSVFFLYLDTIQGVLKSLESITSTNDVLASLRTLTTLINTKEKYIQSKQVVLSQKEIVDECLGHYKTIQQKDEELSVLAGLIERIETKESALKKQIEIKQNKEAEFKDIFPEVCPLCGRS